MRENFKDHRVEGARYEIVNKLWELAEGFDHLGKTSLAVDALSAWTRVRDGDTSVQVGHTTYEVTES